MLVSSTEVQNNFGKYLMLALTGDIIITRNGMPVAKLSALGEGESRRDAVAGIVAEEAAKIGYGIRKATYEEFLKLNRHTEERYEYIDGQIYLLASPKIPHQLASAELFAIFHRWFQGKSCHVLAAPCDITLTRSPEHINVVQPDIAVICDLEEHLADDGYYMGVPTLLVEILSDSTRVKDLIKKLDLYRACGVGEYWIVDLDSKAITVHTFQDSDFGKMAIYQEPRKAKSQVFPGLDVDLVQAFR
ncbi:MAG: type II toxin-antitoxin system Phd/YefM family antitoxin [Firmicutes bacterium]|nr:type II toxin-antitoxin system Phd/YefM family antitoxin [Bacillota bacterium]